MLCKLGCMKFVQVHSAAETYHTSGNFASKRQSVLVLGSVDHLASEPRALSRLCVHHENVIHWHTLPYWGTYLLLTPPSSDLSKINMPAVCCVCVHGHPLPIVTKFQKLIFRMVASGPFLSAKSNNYIPCISAWQLDSGGFRISGRGHLKLWCAQRAEKF